MALHAGELAMGRWLGRMANLTPSRWPRALGRLAARSVDAAQLMAPAGLGRARRAELVHKADIARWILYATENLGMDSRRFELGVAVDLAVAKVPDDWILWALEGLAYDYFRTLLIRGASPSDCFRSIPRRLLPILHTGLGLALAEQVISTESRRLSVSSADSVIDRSLDLCRDFSLSGHAGIALESFAAWTCCHRRSWLSPLAAGFAGRRIDGPADRLLWHGAGRGLYLTPIRSLPGYGSLDDALSAARRFQLEPAAEFDLLAGLGFAFFSVNLSDPSAVETLLRSRYPGRDRGRSSEIERRGLGRGLVAAIEMRRWMPGGERAVDSFLGYRAKDPSFWDAWIVEPAEHPASDSLHRQVGIGP